MILHLFTVSGLKIKTNNLTGIYIFRVISILLKLIKYMEHLTRHAGDTSISPASAKQRSPPMQQMEGQLTFEADFPWSFPLTHQLHWTIARQNTSSSS